ncbi:phosphomannomutase/phosphoglucomutase [Desemzia sp. RIT 804]|uniref:phosphomannomutase/phosphoglucomutase n=1 Tax=Desemzia sp. RIT 804 TaxID=2810209 RepID=UPI001F15CF90|nr:phosphomannomutase/phosphoglucomutase [Desemzia sp. RIT 804]
MTSGSTNELLKLQNGSDIRGIAIETIEQELTLHERTIECIAYGFACWLKEKKQLVMDNLEKPVKVAIGQDSRLSGNRIKQVLIESLNNAGIDVIDVELATTPALFMATQYESYACDASIMITASHLPFQYNGLKFFTADGGAEHEDITYMLENANWDAVTWENNQGIIEKKNLLEDYAADLRQKIQAGIKSAQNPELPLEGKHIIVDAGNGAGGFFATEVLEKLGADISGSQFLEPDGNFPNHVPNPDNKEAMASIKAAVLENHADMGVIFDTDVDRSALVDRNGQTVNRNNLIAVISSIVINENPGTTIVTSSATSEHLKNFIEQLGGHQNRHITGYRNVINQAIKLNQEGTHTSLAIETSGHAALKENYFLDDGAYLIAKILIADAELSAEGKEFASLFEQLKQPVETDEVRFKITTDTVQQTGERVIESFKEFIAQIPDMEIELNNLEGVRVNTTGSYGTGWFLLRLSLHEPLLVLYFESDQEGSIAQLREEVKDFFDQQEGIDTSKL